MYKLLIIFLIMIPTANAWQWSTHQNIVEYVYFSLPTETQNKLNLTMLKEGAIIPDRDFKDHKFHHYPESLEEARKWLENGTDLSLNLGIASHYITDTFAAPHNIFGETSYQHSQFEKQVGNYYPNVECKDYGFELNYLAIGKENSKDWYKWLKTKDRKIPEKEVDQSTRLIFSIFLNKLNATCRNETEIIVIPYFTKKKLAIISLALIMGLYFLKKM